MSFYDAIRIGASGASKDLEIDRSLRFNDGDSAYLNRTFGSAGNRKTYTISAWVKISHLGTTRPIFSRYTGNSDSGFLGLYVNTDDFIYFTGWSTVYLKSSRIYRDPTAWSHIVLAVDTTQSTSTDRIKLYFNGELQSTATYNAPSQNADLVINEAVEHRIGNYQNVYFDGYMAEVNFVDGLQLAPSSFGKTDVETNQWIPQKYVGAYGTNGFRITYGDNSGTTATTLGKDESGNGNNFTPNNFSVAANLANDSMPDTPSNNFCTLNPINASSSVNFGNLDGNLVFDQTSNDQAMTGTFFISPQTGGKWYWEIYKNASQNPEIGICGPQTRLSARSDGIMDERLAFISNSGNIIRTGASSTATLTGGTAQTGAGWLRIACDMDNKKIWWSDTSGNYFNSGNPATGANAGYDFSSHATKDGWTPYVFMGTGSGHNCYVNFGQFDLNNFSSNIPAGFKTLTSANLPDPTVKIPNKHFDTLLYTGNSTDNRAITGLNFQPDLTWIKRRSGGAQSHFWVDALRSNTDGSGGNGNVGPLATNDTYAETATLSDGGFESFNPDGFTLGKGSSTANADAPYQRNNANSGTYCAWNWNGGDTDSATYRVVVVSDSGNKYRFRNSANTATFAQSAVTLDLAEGGTYTFDGSDSTMDSHPIKLSTTANGTHGGGSSYNTGVTYQLDGATVTESAYVSGYSSATSRKLIITVAASAPTLYYYCHVHSGMGGAINTNTTLGSSNFDGGIQTVVKANTSAGFSIVGYTGTNGNGTIGHGLGVVPKFVIVKRRPTASDWAVYHEGLGNSVRLVLNSTAGASNSSAGWWNNTSPTSSIVYLGNDAGLNGTTDTYVAYCFSEVEGFSKFGFYKGNNDTNGTFIFTGFRPAWVMIKNRHRSSAWYILDNKRDPDNPAQEYLAAEDAAAEGTYVFYDFLANGFKLRNVGNAQNANGENIVFFAFAEAPFKYSRAR